MSNTVTVSTKVCSKCKDKKHISEFYKNKDGKNGLHSLCRICHGQNHKKWKSKHKNKNKLRLKKWYLDHKEENKIKRKQRRIEHRKEILLKEKQYRLEHKDELELRNKKYYYHKQKTDMSFRISRMCRCMVSNALRGSHKFTHTMNYFMCNRQEFINHIEKQFEPWMNWNNHGNGIGKWQIDHIIPCSFFNMADEVEKYMCCRWQNLRPLSWEDNREKGSKLI